MYKRVFVVVGLVLFAWLALAALPPGANASPAAQMGNFPALYYNFIDSGGTDCPVGSNVYAAFDNEIFKYWPEGTSPVPGIVNTTNYMVCWNGTVYFPQAGTYTVYTLNDDGMNVWVNGSIAMNAWYDQGPTFHQGDFTIPAPGTYSFQVKYYNRPNAGVACVSWGLKNQPYNWRCPYPPGSPPPVFYPTPTPVPCPYNPYCNNPPPPCQWPNCNNPPPPCQWPNCYNPPPPAPPPQVVCWYRIRYGDTLYSIAWRFGVTAWQLQQWNNIPNPNLIYAGMLIRVCGN